jgi:hypothetical protein
MVTRLRGALFVLVFFSALGSTGCGAAGPWEAQDAWSSRSAPLEESMLPPAPTSSTADSPPPGFFRLFEAIFAFGHAVSRNHVACGPDDDACAFRLQSAPVHAGDWNNRFPTL